MAIRICKHCQQRYTISNHSGDYIHQCHSGDNTLDQENVLVVGDWEDYTGSGLKPAQEAMTQCLANDAWGTRAGIEGADIKDDRSDRGKPICNTRTRQHLHYISDENKKNEI